MILSDIQDLLQVFPGGIFEFLVQVRSSWKDLTVCRAGSLVR